jgi:hypothetical protein
VHEVVLPVYEHDTDAFMSPPEHVLTVSVVGERAFLSVRKYEETPKVTTTREIVSEAVSAEALLNALVMQMGVEWVQGLLRVIENDGSGAQS